jgi:hypothetical protein
MIESDPPPVSIPTTLLYVLFWSGLPLLCNRPGSLPQADLLSEAQKRIEKYRAKREIAEAEAQRAMWWRYNDR